MIATLERYAYMPDVTLGRLSIGSFEGFTLECPWKENKSFESCLPEGFYVVTRTNSPKYGLTYKIHVPDREHMLFHPANWVHQLNGCVAMGEYVPPTSYNVSNRHGAMVANSKNMFKKFLEATEGLNSFRLHVTHYRPEF